LFCFNAFKLTNVLSTKRQILKFQDTWNFKILNLARRKGETKPKQERGEISIYQQALAAANFLQADLEF